MRHRDLLLHKLGLHSMQRCEQLHSWRWDPDRLRWVVSGPPEVHGKTRVIELPAIERIRHVDVPTGEMEPPRRLPDVRPVPPTEAIAAVLPPGRHRPKADRIVPPERRRDG